MSTRFPCRVWTHHRKEGRENITVFKICLLTPACLLSAEDRLTNHSRINQPVSLRKASEGSEELRFGPLEENEFVLTLSSEPKWIAAGVPTSSKMIIDFHEVIISSNHKRDPSTLRVRL